MENHDVRRAQTDVAPASTDLFVVESTISAATEPVPNQVDHEKIKKRSNFQRAQTVPMLGLSRQSYTIPEKVMEQRPTVKQEVSFFYSIVQSFGAMRHQLLDKTFERCDTVVDAWWELKPVKASIGKYHQWEKKFIIGEFLQVTRCFLNTRTVLLLPFFPAGIVCYKRGMEVEAVVFLFLALMYFAKVLSNTTEVAAEHFGPVIGALLNATFGNLVELIISGTTVSKDDATLTITNLIGSIVSNNLFVMGSCCFFGGLEGVPIHQKKPLTSHLVFFLCITLLLSLMSVMSDLDADKISLKYKMDTSQIGASFIFLNYLVYLAMNTNEEFKALKVRRTKRKADADIEAAVGSESDSDSDDGGIADEDAKDSRSTGAEEKEELPSKVVCFGALALTIAGLGPTANFFVEALKELTDGKNISKVFVGLIILPLAGSLPEHISSVISAHKGNMDLAMNLAIGSSNQVIGFVLPIIQFISSKYPSTGFTLYIVDEIASYLYVTAFVTVLVLGNGMLFGLNVWHGVLCLSAFGVIIYLTFANG